MRYFITLSYDGTRYHGWQVQPNGISVQGELQRALSLILRQDIQVTGAGRTDTGVHARMMVAHFDLNSQTSNLNSQFSILSQLVYKLNRLLPSDIAIQKIEPVSDDLHARFSATSRTYRYFIHTCKSPFVRHYSWQTHYALDFPLMNEAAAMLLEYDDFGAFCKSHADVKTTLCKVTHAQWHQTSDSEWYFEITANRFLRNMVRAVVGTLIDVGRHRLSLDDFRKVIEGKRRTEAGESMPANALFLENITY
ncbi:MAG: tRNA pseudouridine(38-40) synthase TruA [Prevotella sp.]|nr:tRNA pseudouridine(38-40) synthase TruA [Prevotella sp.]MBR3480500.1 tRNA pseudouridine(38-40) synthase TruA [Prevotella sp.]